MKKIILISMSLCFGVEGVKASEVVPSPLPASQNNLTAPIQADRTEMDDAELDGVLSSLEQLKLSESNQRRDLWFSLSTLMPPFRMISLDRSSGASTHPVDSKGAGKTKSQELTKAQVAALLFGTSQNANTKECYSLNQKARNKIVMMGCQRRKENGRYFKKK